MRALAGVNKGRYHRHVRGHGATQTCGKAAGGYDKGREPANQQENPVADAGSNGQPRRNVARVPAIGKNAEGQRHEQADKPGKREAKAYFEGRQTGCSGKEQGRTGKIHTGGDGTHRLGDRKPANRPVRGQDGRRENAVFQPVFWLSPHREVTPGCRDTEVQPTAMATGASPSPLASAQAGFVIIILHWIIPCTKAYIRSN
nr:hypothetical protein [Phyllobacterium myrsinacearum]